MRPRLCRMWVVWAGAALLPAGCSDAFNAGPPRYVEQERLTTDFKDKPVLQGKVRAALAKHFGDAPNEIKVPEGSGLPLGGAYLANYVKQGDAVKSIAYVPATPTSGSSDPQPVEGGYGLYRKHCLHCHGVSGAGDGPTSSFLYPRPRDYRKGLFKFTSTPTGAKPTRSDLRKTIEYGLHGTSMPAFEALMSKAEIEQVIDYVIFLSLRGESELSLIDEASTSDEKDPEALSEDVVKDIIQSVAKKWQAAESLVMNPPTPRVEPTHASVMRGRELFLGLNKTGNKVECAGCHGPQAVGNGPTFVAQEVFNHIVFGGNPSAMPERVAELEKSDPKAYELWKTSLDEWGNPLRPANLNRGIYKGGRRPLDIYWRIAKGINGAKMPSHFPTLEPDKIWDLVNFVLELPYEPKLLEGAKLPEALPAAKTAGNAAPTASESIARGQGGL